jgi:anti-sigma regulatory factor (Ser/Thr protein kinase)
MATDDENGVELASSRCRFELRIPRQPVAPALARAGFVHWVDGGLSAAARTDALLVLSELVTNSVRHAHAPDGAPVRVTAELQDRVLRLEVGDAGHDRRFTRRRPDLQAGGGFGLHLVERLSLRWGVAESDGTVVWCELPRG